MGFIPFGQFCFISCIPSLYSLSSKQGGDNFENKDSIFSICKALMNNGKLYLSSFKDKKAHTNENVTSLAFDSDTLRQEGIAWVVLRYTES